MINHKFKFFNSSLLILLIGSSAIFAGNKASDVVKKLRKRYENFKTLQASFTQTTVWALAGDEQSISGRFFVLGNDKYRVETDAQIIVSDGKTVWTLSKEKNQVVINSLSKSSRNQMPRDLLVKYTREFDAKLMGEKIYKKNKCLEIIFTPRNEEALVVKTQVLMDKKSNLAMRFEQEDINENITRYELSDYAVDQQLDKSLFSFQLPPDAEVVDMR